MRALVILFASSILLAGCPTRNQVGTSDGGSPDSDGARSDGNKGDGDGSTAVVPNSVSITAPTAATTYTNGSVSIVVFTDHPTSAPISIIATGATAATVGTVTAPQASFNWNTTGVAEGTYSVTAQLTSNGKTVTSNAVTIVVDRTPPQVVVSTLVPAPSASDVVLVAPIVAGFSEPLLPSTVTSTTITIQTASATTLPTTVSLSGDGKTATLAITSDKGITLDQAFTGTFSSSITDLAGNPLAHLATAWSWDVPAWIKYAPLNSNSPPLLAVGSNYQPIVAYTVCGPGTPASSCPTIMHVAVSDGQAWNDIGIPGTGAITTDAAIFVDAQNHPIVAWGDETTSGVGEVIFAAWDGTAWQSTTYPPIVLSAAEGVNVDDIALTLDGTGHPVVAYRADIFNPSTKTDIYVASWTGTAWNTSFGAVGDPSSKTFDIVLNDQNEPIVSVVDTTNNSGVFLWTGSSWASTAGAGATNASVALDASGNPVMLNSVTTNWVPEHLTNGTWLPTVSIPVPSSTTSSSPSIANTTDRLPVVAWYDPAQSPSAIGLARWTGTAWDNRAGFANGGNFPNGFPPQLIVDARNAMWIAWAENQKIYVWMSNY